MGISWLNRLVMDPSSSSPTGKLPDVAVDVEHTTDEDIGTHQSNSTLEVRFGWTLPTLISRVELLSYIHWPDLRH